MHARKGRRTTKTWRIKGRPLNLGAAGSNANTSASRATEDSPSEATSGSPPQATPKLELVVSPENSSLHWRETLRQLTRTYAHQARNQKHSSQERDPNVVVGASQALWFVMTFDELSRGTEFKIKLLVSNRKKNGDWSVPSFEPRLKSQLLSCPYRNRSEIRALNLLRWTQPSNYGYYGYSPRQNASSLSLEPHLLEETLQELCDTGHFVWSMAEAKSLADYVTIDTDSSERWRFVLELTPVEGTKQVQIRAELQRTVEAKPGHLTFDVMPVMRHLESGFPPTFNGNNDSGSEDHLADHPPSGDNSDGHDEKLRQDASDSQAEQQSGVVFQRRPGEAVRDLDQVVAVCDSGAVLFQNRIGTLPANDVAWVRAWRGNPTLTVPQNHLSKVIEKLASVGNIPSLQVDSRLQIGVRQDCPVGLLRLKPVDRDPYRYEAHFSFRYGEFEIGAQVQGEQYFDPVSCQLICRDNAEETRLLSLLNGLPLEHILDLWNKSSVRLHKSQLAAVVSNLNPQDWEVYVAQERYRSGGKFQIDVTSGVDWFDVQGNVDFDGAAVDLPEILRAIRQGDKFVLLNDGTHGMLPESLLKELRPLTDLATLEGPGLRFKSSQALLLESLLAEREFVSFDLGFQRWCEKLKRFSGVQAATQPRGFRGELRHYQQEGLGWLKFLNEFQFGGCLADDMGLGKTIQVLAMLEKRRQRRLKSDQVRKPSLVLVPKSLVFNWIDEALKFTPKLKVIDYTGLDRASRLPELTDDAVLLTTYHTFRLDIQKLKDIQFDYAILDEAQAIKNPTSQASKAVRLIQADHRLAMTGTPVENHLGDLWSLFDFLNPGMLGPSLAARTRLTGEQERGSLEALGRALRPFILRRTKSQVLTELPPKTEQTLYCDLDAKQRKHYEQIRNHYRAKLLLKVESDGIQKSKIHVLEALLRLRQAACDLRLVDATQQTVGAKLELLLEQLEEVIPEGHKVLVFSQFTSYLSLIKKSLDRKGWKYQYLDGKTNNRAAEVKQFQNDESCSIFLISLKAGGNGLNLTAADYVYIMDPWWNPAVEAQAIDRSHRMGQERPVTAYRVIARDTIEEKILQLQQSKRELADAIISADKSLLQKLSLEDLQVLFE